MVMKALRPFTDQLNKLISLSPDKIIPLVAFQWGCNTTRKPDPRHVIWSLGKTNTVSLYYNGIFYFRLMLPFYVGFMIRWSGNPAHRWQFLQAHAGWKLNGEFAVTIRVQNDKSGAESNKGPAYNNTGQAQGWSCGTK